MQTQESLINHADGAGDNNVVNVNRPSVRECLTNYSDPSRDLYPFSIVWTNIPCISWFIPVVGHAGICDSTGRVWDFQGPYYIGVDNMAFGRPYRVWNVFDNIENREALLDSRTVPELWDEAVRKGSDKFGLTMHNLFTNNCHHHVADCLNNYHLNGFDDWSQVDVAAKVFFKGRYVSKCRFFSHLTPFLIILLLIVGLVLTLVFALK